MKRIKLVLLLTNDAFRGTQRQEICSLAGRKFVPLMMHNKITLADKKELARLRDTSRGNDQLFNAFLYLHLTIKEDEVLVLIDDLPAASVKDNGREWVFSVIMGKFTKATLKDNRLQLSTVDAVIEYQYKAAQNSWAQVLLDPVTCTGQSVQN